MDTKRRDFLKVAGLTTLAGLGGTTVVDRLVAGVSVAQASTAAGRGRSMLPLRQVMALLPIPMPIVLVWSLT